MIKAKRLVTFLLLLSLLFSIPTYATIPPESLNGRRSVEDILNSYQEEKLLIEANGEYSESERYALFKALKDTRNSALVVSGYEVIEVNEDNYYEVEDVLQSDLSIIGLSPNQTYTIIVSEESDGTPLRSSPSSSFSYSYNGTSYTLRYLTVTADDSDDYAQATSVNVLNSSIKTIIKNCLDTAVSAYISAVSSALGTVSSICGLTISDFWDNHNATMYLNGATNWTRKYTQVWSSYDQAWVFGACVEYVYVASYMSGYYYNATTNLMTAVPANESTCTKYSSYYYNTTWQKNRAVQNYINSSPCTYNTTGSVAFKYGGTTKFTHSEPANAIP